MLLCHINLAKGLRGGERQTALLIEQLAQYPIEQCILARYDSPLHDLLRKVPGLRRMALRKPYIKYLYRGVHADLIHAHEAKAGQWAYANFLRTRTPYLITRRVPNPQRPHALNRAIYTYASAVVALSSAIGTQLQACLSTLQPWIVPSMYASFNVDVVLLETLRARYRGKFIVGHVGALVKRHKGQQYLIEVARAIQADYPQLHFLLLGDGEDEASLRAQAAGLSNIEFLGRQVELGSYYRLFDVFAFPSLQEGLGSSLLDAIQAGCPVVAAAVDGIPDIIRHDDNGLLVPPGDARTLQNAILRLYREADLRYRLQTRASHDLHHYAPETIAARYYELYEKLLKAREQV